MALKVEKLYMEVSNAVFLPKNKFKSLKEAYEAQGSLLGPQAGFLIFKGNRKTYSDKPSDSSKGHLESSNSF